RVYYDLFFFFFQAEDGIRDFHVTGVQTCALPILHIPMAFTLVSLALFGLIFFEIMDSLFLGYWLLIGLGITSLYVKRINRLASNTDKVKDTFRQYALLLDLIENESFSSELLQQKQQQIKRSEERRVGKERKLRRRKKWGRR